MSCPPLPARDPVPAVLSPRDAAPAPLPGHDAVPPGLPAGDAVAAQPPAGDPGVALPGPRIRLLGSAPRPPGPRLRLPGVLGVVGALAAACLGFPAAAPAPQAPWSGRPAAATPVMLAPADVAIRDDCPRVPATIEPDCQPRLPTGLPAGGVLPVLAGDPAQAAQVLCSAVSDGVVAATLGRPFLAYTNRRGECHLARSGLLPPLHAVEFAATLSPLPLAAFRALDGPLWQPLRAAALPGGYVAVSDAVRWFRVALGPDPDAPGTLLVACRYVRFAGAGTTRTVPAPAGFWPAAGGYVRSLAAALTR